MIKVNSVFSVRTSYINISSLADQAIAKSPDCAQNQLYCESLYLRYRYMTFGRSGDRQFPKLYSTLTRFLESYLRYRYMTFGRAGDRQIPRLCSKLTQFLDGLYLSVRNDGCGFDPHCSVSGFGLGGMWQRVEQIGAQLEIQSEQGSGTKVIILISV